MLVYSTTSVILEEYLSMCSETMYGIQYVCIIDTYLLLATEHGRVFPSSQLFLMLSFNIADHFSLCTISYLATSQFLLHLFKFTIHHEYFLYLFLLFCFIWLLDLFFNLKKGWGGCMEWGRERGKKGGRNRERRVDGGLMEGGREE